MHEVEATGGHRRVDSFTCVARDEREFFIRAMHVARRKKESPPCGGLSLRGDAATVSRAASPTNRGDPAGGRTGWMTRAFVTRHRRFQRVFMAYKVGKPTKEGAT